MDYIHYLQYLYASKMGRTKKIREAASSRLSSLKAFDPDRYERYTEKIKKAVEGVTA